MKLCSVPTTGIKWRERVQFEIFILQYFNSTTYNFNGTVSFTQSGPFKELTYLQFDATILEPIWAKMASKILIFL